tara:strand:- start:48 stop:980 length:933 start_codon:yes stop_codon:yes gene_type:complete
MWINIDVLKKVSLETNDRDQGKLGGRRKTVQILLDSIYKGDFDQYQCDHDFRLTVASELAKLVRYAYPFSSPEISGESKVILDQLNTDGYVIFPEFANELQLENIINYFSNKTGSASHVHRPGEEYSHNENFPFAMLSYSPKISILCKEIFEFITNPSLINLANHYLECFPTFYCLNVYRTYPNHDSQTHHTHRDWDDFKFLVCFLYLTDVDSNSGAVQFYPRSHRRIYTHNQISIEGKKGTLVICDTAALHNGTIPQSTSRFACWWRYGIWLNGGYNINKGNKDKISRKNFDENLLNDELSYLLRGFLL